MSDIFTSIIDFFRILGPVQTTICLFAVAVVIWLWIALYQASSNNPRHYADEYVKSHMGEFYSWFQNHPEERARYEDTSSGIE